MTGGRLVYRCRFCGGAFHVPLLLDGGVAVAVKKILESGWADPYEPESPGFYAVHDDCPAGACGVGDMIGGVQDEPAPISGSE